MEFLNSWSKNGMSFQILIVKEYLYKVMKWRTASWRISGKHRNVSEKKYTCHLKSTILNLFLHLLFLAHIYEYIIYDQSYIKNITLLWYIYKHGSYLARILYHLDVFSTKFIWVKFEESLRNFWQRCEFGLLVNILLSIFIFKEPLWHNAQLELPPDISPRLTTGKEFFVTRVNNNKKGSDSKNKIGLSK